MYQVILWVYDFAFEGDEWDDKSFQQQLQEGNYAENNYTPPSNVKWAHEP